jgi:hypothetical protein
MLKDELIMFMMEHKKFSFASLLMQPEFRHYRGDDIDRVISELIDENKLESFHEGHVTFIRLGMAT